MVRDCSQALASPSVLCMVRWRLNEITAEQVGAGTTLEVYIAVPPALGWNGLPDNGRRLEAGLIEMIRPPWNKMGGRGMMKRWQRVSMDASAEDGITMIRITRGRKGDAMLKWRPEALVPAAVRQRKRRLAVSHAGQLGRQIGQLVADEVHHLPFPRDASADAEHGRRKMHAPEFLEDLDPDDDVCRRLILHGEEHEAFGRARPLPDQHQAGCMAS